LTWFAEEHPVFTPGMPEPDQFVLKAALRMERMRDTKSLRTLATAGS
jgi:hypothetical protein